MTTKKKTPLSKPMNGAELYKQDKLPWRIYLEAVFVATAAQGVDPMMVSKEIRDAAFKQALKELGYG